MPKLPSQQYTFQTVPSISAPRCSLRRPMTYKTTMGTEYLYPIYCDEVVPGDTFNVDVSAVARLTTPIVPVMDNAWIDFHFFFVPSRLVWDNFVKLCGETSGPSDAKTFNDYSIPAVNFGSSGTASVGSIYDYFGIPTGVKLGQLVMSLPFRAYQKIWNEWFRREDLQDEITVSTGDSNDAYTVFSLLPRCKQHDYITSCQPFTQKGPQIGLPLADTIPVIGNGNALGIALSSTATNTGRPLIYTQGNKDLSVGSSLLDADSPTPVGSAVGATAYTGNNPFYAGLTQVPETSGLVALTSQAGGTINEFREAFALQKLLERDSRSGTRYTEVLQAHFGIKNPDSRLQRSEFLGSFSLPINFHSVAQTSATSDTETPQGNLSAFALASGTKKGFLKSFTEFGYVIGVASVRADLTYQQGLRRMWSRRKREDLAWIEFNHLGEQAVYNKEVFCQDYDSVDSDGNSVNDLAFGYQERFAEYKYGHSLITGQLRSTYAQSLDVWHFAEKFDSLPTLSSSFITSKPPIARSLAVQDVPEIILDAYFDVKCVRPMSLFSTPGLIDHF